MQPPIQPGLRRSVVARRRSLIILAACTSVACASSPDAPAPGRSLAWGDLRLVPREGVKPSGGGGSSYGDRRMRDVEFVDYSQPGFAVVFAEANPPADELLIAILSDRIGTRLEPGLAAVGSAGRVVVRNESDRDHILSYPAANVARKLAVGESIAISPPRAGEQSIFLLDVPTTSATVFAAPGPYTVVKRTGRFVLSDLSPGKTTIRAWHPRLPSASKTVELAPDVSLRVDFEIGVGRSEVHTHAH